MHMTSCIPIRVLLVYDGILQYSFGFGFYTRGPHECKNTKKTACCWILKSLVGNCRYGRFPVVKITDCVQSRDDSSQHVPSRIVLNALSVTNSITKVDKCFKLHTMHFTCSCWMQLLHSLVRKAGHSVQTFFLSLSFLSPEIRPQFVDY